MLYYDHGSMNLQHSPHSSQSASSIESESNLLYRNYLHQPLTLFSIGAILQTLSSYKVLARISTEFVPVPSSHSRMASIMRSAATSALVVAVIISSAGVALAHEGHIHAPAPGPAPASAAAGLLPGSVVASFVVAITGFLAARFM
ncbi:hypothetical protein Mapa_006192 [Marchantia paleacea]|nr:hypothetical protein Mapa_006192 [Marchantia paleacea]